MASPRPAAAQQLRLADGAQHGSEISFHAQRQRQAAQLAASAAMAALGDESPVSDDDQTRSERMPLNSRGGGGGGSSSTSAGLVTRGSASPSGFGLSSSLHPFPPPSNSPSGFAQKREKMKGHPVLRLNQSATLHTQHAALATREPRLRM